MDDKAMFPGLGEALRWTWYGSVVASNTVKEPTYAQFQSANNRGEKPRRSRHPDVGGVPRGLLAAGQAGALKGHVEDMPGDEQAHVMARFLRGREKVTARRKMRRYICDYIGAEGVERRAVGLLMVPFYSTRRSRVSVASVAAKLQMDWRRVNRLKRRMTITLNALAYRAEMRIYDELQKRRLIL